MKHSITWCFLLLLLTFYGCKKENSLTSNFSVSNLFLDSAVQYLKTNLLESEFQNLDLTRSRTLVYKNQNFGVQIFEKGNNNKFLILQIKNSSYSGNWVDMSGLTESTSHYKSGNIFLESIGNNSVTKLVVENNKVIETDKKAGNNSATDITYFNKGNSSGNTNNASSPDVDSQVLPDIIIYYDVNSGSGIDYLSWYWLVDQTAGGSYAYFPSSGGGGGGGTGSGNTSNIVNAPLTLSPEAPITDLKQELKCFTNSNTSTYSVSVNVNEPDPGTRDLVNPISPYPVGHTFLTLEQDNADGSSIIRSVGFYPKNSVKPGTEKDQSIFGNDSNTPYDITLNISVTGSEMNTVLTQLKYQQALQYDLNNFNCTNSAMEALNSININLPSTKSDELLFSGNDPGDLGEDLRNLNLNAFSAENGDRKIVRTASNSDNQYPKEKTGSCD